MLLTEAGVGMADSSAIYRHSYWNGQSNRVELYGAGLHDSFDPRALNLSLRSSLSPSLAHSRVEPHDPSHPALPTPSRGWPQRAATPQRPRARTHLVFSRLSPWRVHEPAPCTRPHGPHAHLTPPSAQRRPRSPCACARPDPCSRLRSGARGGRRFFTSRQRAHLAPALVPAALGTRVATAQRWLTSPRSWKRPSESPA